ncbi:agmatine deiminase family protein [Myxococcota bacterium]|nr:agmatine deiminase family protein [Myxococcota bacterium]MBU1535720.1 agmatine deiminase family protein [Myxococcota bacterium]
MFTALLCNLLLFSSAPAKTYTPVPQASLKKILPAWQLKGVLKDSSAQLFTYREEHPELYGITVAPGASYNLYAEFATMDRIYLVYSDDMRDYWVQIIREAASQMEVFVMTGEEGQASATQTILESQIDPSLMANVTVLDFYPTEHYVFNQPSYDAGIDAIWTVDFGPFYLVDQSGNIIISDAKYYPERINDDAVPTKLGDMFGLPTFRPDIYIEGGNLLSDGLGNCYTTTVVQYANPKYSLSELETVMSENLGCHNVVWLTPQQDEGTGHIDMFFILADAHTALVGEYTSAQDSTNKSILDQNAALISGTLAGDGSPITVYRIPMPDPGSDYWGRVWRTYTNGLRINDKYLIPVYADESTQQGDAIAALQMAIPGVTIIPVPSDEIITYGGAVHCTTRTRPSGTAATLDDPEYLCGGHSQCDDCTDECALGETGCNIDGSRYICGNFDDDTCLDKLSLPCPSASPCDSESGMCAGYDCTDECLPSELGCDGTDSSWMCGEVGDADPCLDKIVLPCHSGRECNAGICTGTGGQCGDIDYDGECQGTYSVYCDEDYLIVDDCAAYGLVCGYLNAEGYYDCVEPKTCQDECEIAEVRCSTDESDVEYCAETFDGDTCLEWRSDSCPLDTVCSENGCVSDCEDECTLDEMVCADETTLNTCVADLETGCTVWTSETCQDGDVCNATDLTCKAPKTSDSGCGCSTPGTSGSSSFPLFFMLLGGLMLALRRKFFIPMY